MAKKRGKQKQSSPSSSSPSLAHDVSSKKASASPHTLNLDLLKEQEIEFNELFDSLDSMNEKQIQALMENMDKIREKIKGKKPCIEDSDHITNPLLMNLEQVKEGLIPPERVNEKELHPAVIMNNEAQVVQGSSSGGVQGSQGSGGVENKNGDANKWQTVTTRRRAQMQKNLESEGGRGSPTLPING
ncbi:hypothetical protein RIF29_26544 [Crotalaria pallida]|uniref:Uncharacterized protein n=1 Tax=Crotalaria pallida TaxID=3830 RepID=A0AAN9ENG2_CROPI